MLKGRAYDRIILNLNLYKREKENKFMNEKEKIKIKFSTVVIFAALIGGLILTMLLSTLDTDRTSINNSFVNNNNNETM